MQQKLIILSLALLSVFQLRAADEQFIRISTDRTDLVLQVASDSRLYQAYLGEKLSNPSEFAQLPFTMPARFSKNESSRKQEVYPCSGTEDYFEPAFAIQHNDGNLTSVLKYVSSETKALDGNVSETTILLKDDVYPVEVKLIYTAFAKENIIKSRTEIVHREKKPVFINRYASSMLYFNSPSYHLTEFPGDWAKEVHMTTTELKPGKKILDTKLGTRAAMFMAPFFEVGIGEEPNENRGTVLMGTLAWTGNFRFTFEVDYDGKLRVISGINPYASNYELKPNEVFSTPEFIFTLSQQGTGEASRNLHRWARDYQVKDGKADRMTLLNNWEATGFKFNEPKLEEIMHEAKDLGVDMFLLDDGWFGNKHPRTDAVAGLGDWDVMKSKLPNGVPHLVQSAKDAGVKFGIWIEPEMVNPKSELAEKHPDWIIQLPNREPYVYRSQWVLDLSNPKVQDFVFGVVDNLMKENPDLAYMKWDCNSPITNIYSPYLKDKQNQMYIDHVRGFYNVCERVKAAYPNLPLMLCSGGGGRCDYGALKYFTEFWCSDNTDPIERLFIQWGFSQFFPAKTMCAHVTSWNRRASIKFRTDVAMMCKMGFDIDVKELSEKELSFCKEAVKNYNRIKSVIFEGDLYRLVSPYEGNHASMMYVDNAKKKAVLYAYDIYPRYGEKLFPVRLQGLNPSANYRVEEINQMNKPSGNAPARVYSGDYLMKVGLNILSGGSLNSKIFEITAE